VWTRNLAFFSYLPKRENPNLTRGKMLHSVADRGSFFGGVTWNSCDERTSVAFAFTLGEEPDGIRGYSPMGMYSLVLSRQLGCRWNYVLQHDLGVQTNGTPGGDAWWYSLNQYLFYKINPNWDAGLRVEWFNDRNGALVDPQNRGGHWYEVSAGLNYKPSRHITIRPELRWDFFDAHNPAAMPGPFDDNTARNQFLAGLDVIISY